jgi:hypothetical protein
MVGAWYFWKYQTESGDVKTKEVRTIFLPVHEQCLVLHSVSATPPVIPSTFLTASVLAQSLVVELLPLVLHQFHSTGIGSLLAIYFVSIKKENIQK